MRIFTLAQELQNYALEQKRSGRAIALVPTMGFLHAGHASLIDIARKKADIVIVSIFVNPTQFGQNEDFDKYPRDFEHDQQLCSDHGVNVIFAPDANTMYQPDASTWVEETVLSKPLCGIHRPIHFRGVITVVAKLFNITLPDYAVFGQKDAQQLLVIQRMVRNLNFPIEIIVEPLVRCEDGLALSSHNRYLSETKRLKALSLSQALREGATSLRKGGISIATAVTETIKQKITTAGGKVDYVEALDATTRSIPTA